LVRGRVRRAPVGHGPEDAAGSGGRDRPGPGSGLAGWRALRVRAAGRLVRTHGRGRDRRRSASSRGRQPRSSSLSRTATSRPCSSPRAWIWRGSGSDRPYHP
jgi:hypothetical protein